MYRRRFTLKKVIFKLIIVVMLTAVLGIVASSLTGSFNNFSNPRSIVLPASEGCGDNVVGLYVDETLFNDGGTHYSKYKWNTLTGNQTVLHACHAVRFDIKNTIIIAVDPGLPSSSQITDQFFGDDITTSTYHSVPSESAYVSNTSISGRYSYNTKAINPFSLTIITNDTYIHFIQ